MPLLEKANEAPSPNTGHSKMANFANLMINHPFRADRDSEKVQKFVILEKLDHLYDRFEWIHKVFWKYSIHANFVANLLVQNSSRKK